MATQYTNSIGLNQPLLLSTDPLDLAIDPVSGDLVFAANGDLTLSSGTAGVVQACRIAMQLVAGEWFMDLDAGIPLFERDGVPASKALLGQKFNKVKARDAFYNALSAVPGVVAIVSLTVDFTDVLPPRTLNVAWTVQTAFGDTPSDSLALGVN